VQASDPELLQASEDGVESRGTEERIIEGQQGSED